MTSKPIDPAQIVKQLSEMIDLIEYQDVIGRKTRYGKKPGPDPWHHTRALLKTYTNAPDAKEVIRLFESAGCKDEVAAAKWIVIHDDLVS
jgi:hypothetical protein